MFLEPCVIEGARPPEGLHAAVDASERLLASDQELRHPVRHAATPFPLMISRNCLSLNPDCC